MTEATRPYEQLGLLLKEWRRGHFRSASELHRKIEFSFSYKTYMEFEGGVSLPSLAQLLEMAQALEQEPSSAVLLWAEVQMPTEKLKSLFRRDGAAPFSSKGENAEPDFEKTWVFGKAEHDFLTKEPWFFEFCLRLVMEYPNEVSFSALGFENPEQITRFSERYLAPWLMLARIKTSETGIRAVEPHIFIPQTPDWNAVRARNFMTAYESLSERITPDAIRKKEALREIITRPMRFEQVTEWINELQGVGGRFRGLPGGELPSGRENPVYSMLVAFAPRKLALPADILLACKSAKK